MNPEMESRHKRILVVDDKPNNLSLVTSILRPDYEVLLANNGERALTIARDQIPDLILLDIMMPGISGFEVCSILKKDPVTAEIPVIFLTARNDSDDFEKAYDIGAVDYTTKPINVKELMMRIKTHLLIAEQRNNLIRLNERITHINEELEEQVAKRTAALSRAKENLERQNSDLAQFSHIVSHNLRGPVASALGLTQLFDWKNPSNPVNGDVLIRMTDSVRNIDTILKDISSILDIRENIPAVPDQFNPAEIINSILLGFSGHTAKPSFQLDIGVASMSGYKHYFEKITFNLIDNAVRYAAPDRPVELKISLKEISGFYVLEITDNGLGIEEKDFDRIFEPFKKLSYDSKGRGLGLYQVKTMIHSLGGSASVTSTPGVGSTFTVRFPALSLT